MTDFEQKCHSFKIKWIVDILNDKNKQRNWNILSRAILQMTGLKPDILFKCNFG